MPALELGFHLVFWMGIGVLIVTRFLSRRRYILPTVLYAVLLIPFVLCLVIHGCKTLGTGSFAVLVLLGMVIPAAGETVALRSGFVGKYRYSIILGPSLPGGLPVMVMLMWGVIMVVVFWAALAVYNGIMPDSIIAEGVGGVILKRLIFCLIAAFLAVIFDLVMDPVMTKGGFWGWKHDGIWYGVPLANYIGWFVSTFVIFILYMWIFSPLEGHVLHIFPSSVQVLFSMLYVVMLLDLSVTALERKLKGAAWVGFSAAAVVGVIIV